MSEKKHLNPECRHDFVMLFDVTDGNPNGDPDAGNLPRVDPETMHGLVTDVCLKRKVRNYVNLRKGTEERFKIYVEEGAVLNEQHERAYTAEGIEATKKPSKAVKDKVRAWMCANFFDVRMFGAVMSTGVNCGQVRGPLQMTFARSIDPITPLDISITRVAVTKGGESKETEMGRKALVPYGLYRVQGFFSAKFAQETDVKVEDLAVFWEALENMWDHDRSASRGMMACRGLYIFSHENSFGNAPAHKLFDRISVQRKGDATVARAFADYEVTLSEEALPEGVSLTTLG